MRIVSVSLPSEMVAGSGLEPVEMTRLGPVVVLAGPNGAGKTRLLQLVEGAIEMKGVPQECVQRLRQLEAYADRSHQEDTEREVREQRQRLASIRYDRADGEIGHRPAALHFVPLGVGLQDARDLTPINAERQADEVSRQLGFKAIQDGATAYLQRISARKRNATHQNFRGAAGELKTAIAELARLQDILDGVLGQTLGDDIDGNATLFGMPVGHANLSAGQRVLLQFAVALHAQAGKLDEYILLLDEPEEHLHPAALTDTITRLEKLVPYGQVWIATHSVHVLAHVDPSSIWYMDAGKVEYVGRKPEKVLRGLVGEGDNAYRLRAFLDLPAQLAHAHFAAQCLLPPGVADVTNDKQSKQMTNLLLKRAEGGRLHLVDYGAGRGRLLRALHEAGLSSLPPFAVKDRIDYYAIDASIEHKVECEAVLRSVYGEGARWFDAVRPARAKLGDATVDVVVLCNVLHEVDPAQWLTFFEGLRPLLADDGVVLIVEDHAMPIGEKAHPKGFLVLDTLALSKLFNLRDGQFDVVDHEGDGRLLAHVVPANALSALNAERRKAALEEMRGGAKVEIKRLRSEGTTFKDGMAHAFWTQQLANATLALDEIG